MELGLCGAAPGVFPYFLAGIYGRAGGVGFVNFQSNYIIYLQGERGSRESIERCSSGRHCLCSIAGKAFFSD